MACPPPSTSSSSAPTTPTDLNRWLAGRIYTPLFLYESQGLEVYRVYPQAMNLTVDRERPDTPQYHRSPIGIEFL